LAVSPDPDRYRRTLDSLLEGFQIIGFDWTYLYVNPSAAAHGRRTPAELEGKKMWEVYPGIDETSVFAEMKRCMDDRVHAALENLFTYPDGHACWFELHLEPVPEGLCVHSFDIQQRKDAQAALTKLNASLEAEVAHRTSELELVNQELEAFTYSVSHDLRAPLRHVAGFATLLQKQGAETLGPKGTHYVERIEEASGRMNRLIDDLLAFSRTGRISLNKERVDLAELIRAAQQEIGSDAARADCVWTIEALPIVDADPALLRLVLVNLLSNALKYTRSASPAQITIGAQTDPEKGEVGVFVRDNGVGFDMQYVDKLFGVFQRLHRAEDFEGTGIGLANVRRIIHRHGGRTWAEGAVNGGATFYFSLPAPEL
jgi:PAS domain S-box-containing protein